MAISEGTLQSYSIWNPWKHLQTLMNFLTLSIKHQSITNATGEKLCVREEKTKANHVVFEFQRKKSLWPPMASQFSLINFYLALDAAAVLCRDWDFFTQMTIRKFFCFLPEQPTPTAVNQSPGRTVNLHRVLVRRWCHVWKRTQEGRKNSSLTLTQNGDPNTLSF